MKPDHFDIFDDDDTDPGMGRWCARCDLWRHGDCKPYGCQATREPGEK